MVNLMDTMYLIRRKSRILLTITLVAVITSGILNLFIIDKVYTSTITLMISNQRDEEEIRSIDYDDIMLGEKLVDTYSIIAKSDPVLETIITELDLGVTIKEFSEQMVIKVQPDKRLLEITMQDNDPQRALDKADIFLDIFLWQIQDILNVNNVQIINSPKFPSHPSHPNVILNLLISIFAGLVVGLIIIYFINYTDNTIGNFKELEKRFNLPILAKFPMGETPEQSYIEFITNLFNGELDSYDHIVLITSSVPTERVGHLLKGLSSVIANLGKNVMVLDCDFNNSVFYKSFDVDNTKGLKDFLEESKKYQVNIRGYTMMYQRNMENIGYYKNYVQSTDIDNIDIIPSGIVTGDDHRLLLSKKMGTLLDILKKDYDMVLINGGSISSQIESLVLAKLTDEIILIESYGESTFRGIERVIEKIGSNRSKIKGFIINQVPSNEIREI